MMDSQCTVLQFVHISELNFSSLLLWIKYNRILLLLLDKYLKDLIARMLDCGYFENVPDPPPPPPPEEPKVLLKEPPKTEIHQVVKTELMREQGGYVMNCKSVYIVSSLKKKLSLHSYAL